MYKRQLSDEGHTVQGHIHASNVLGLDQCVVIKEGSRDFDDLLDDLRCTGTEARLVDCPSNGIGISNHCNGHADDAGVQCQPRKDFNVL